MLRKFEPSDKKNKMESETDLTAAREYFLGGGGKKTEFFIIW